ncbi:winged helix-turn-helix domain-containing protein [Nocardia sp. NEAU-G5]|uniref:Winged helix-turn-helix domain-containing protein n=1 Tax=Nocardia albiluteola TaxID=2842303 RepID=A0ABS6B6S9_9NOCA|nr:BTAD domain-containing putative transcriptional regulator [Nocardia albiluteola]MBU3065858.1 winged helix-turn-helix domain-containing protein [Nocardia albiluteola]
MQVRLLGPVTVSIGDSGAIAIGGPRVRTLLALLALRGGEIVSTERLIDGVWGERPPADAENALHTLVKRLRAAFGAQWVIRRAPGYGLAIDPDALDVHRFACLHAEGTRLLAAGNSAAAADALDRALACWQGRIPLEDLGESVEISTTATVLADKRLTAIEAQADAYLALGRGSEVLRTLAAEADALPLRETLAARLITVLEAAGRESEARQVFRRIEAGLRGELGVEPSAVLRQAVASLDAVPARPDATTAGSPTLPRRLTSFVGRTADVDEVAAMLRRGRLVTLVGTGGVGKTRLATEFVRSHGRDWPDGYLFIEAAAVSPERGKTSGTALGAAMLAAAGLVDRDTPTEDWMQTLVRTLWARRTLLILDNCEHVQRSAAEATTQLLRQLPQLSILATSRAPLSVAGEERYAVLPLALPAPTGTAEHTIDSPAMRLFIDRATAVRPDFAVTEANWPHVRAIVRGLDGLPLAIELAAARLQGFPLAEVAARLDDRFRLLTNGTRLATPRHRSLQAAVAWSWDLLGDVEAALARRMAVFAGGTTPEHLMRVCGDGFSVPRSEIAETARSLAAKSLIEFDGERYRMVETIRAYAAEEAQRAGESEQAARAHADCYIEFAEAGTTGLRDTAHREWLRRFAAEHGNCRTSLQWAVESADYTRSVRLFGNLFWYWQSSGQWGEIHTWQPLVLEVVGDRVPRGCAGAYLTCRYGHYVPEYAATFSASNIPRDIGEFEPAVRSAMAEADAGHPIFLLIFALQEHQRGSPQLLDDCTAAADGWLRGHALYHRAFEKLSLDTFPQALTDLEAAVTCLRESADPGAQARSLVLLAYVHNRLHGIGSAGPLLARAADLFDPDVSTSDRVRMLCWVAIQHLLGGDIAGAASYLTRADEHDPQRVIQLCGVAQGYLAARQGRLEDAINAFSSTIGGPDDPPPTAPSPNERGLFRWADVVNVRTVYGVVLIDAGRLESGQRQLIYARDVAATEAPPMLPDVAVGFAVASLATGHLEHAARIFGAVLHAFGRMGREVLGPDAERVATHLRAVLPEARLTALTAEGAALDLASLLTDPALRLSA